MAILKTVFGESGLTGVSVLAPFLATLFTGEHFLKRERRCPNGTERTELVWGGIIIFFCFNLLGFVVFWTVGGRLPNNTSAVLIFGISNSVVVAVINYFMMCWAYGGLLDKRAKKLNINIADTFG